MNPKKIKKQQFFRLAEDSGGDWYVIPATKTRDWQIFLDSEDYENAKYPDYATYIGGFPCDIKFPEFEVD